MIKFIHKKHIREVEGGKLVIYYNISDIFLGVVLLALVVFFIHDYLSHALNEGRNNCPTFSRSVFDVQKR